MDSLLLSEKLNELKDLVKNHKLIPERKRLSFAKDFDTLAEKYTKVDVPEYQSSLYESLISNGEELRRVLSKSYDNKIILEKTERYLRYLKASIYDFAGNIKGLNYYTRCFIITATLFMVLTPQFYGYMLPLVFLLPIFAGMKGVKKRSITGFYLTASIAPVALFTAITWLRYIIFNVLKDFAGEVVELSAAYKVSQGIASALIIGPGILSVVLTIAAILMIYYGFKYRDMFV